MTLPSLIASLREAGEGSRELDREVYDAVIGYRATAWPKVTTSLDAILGLIREKLPGFGLTIKAIPEPGTGSNAEAWLSRSHPTNVTFEADAPTPALAICIALLLALEPGHE